MQSLPIVCDGAERWWAGATSSIRAEVTAQFAAALEEAGFLQRWRIKNEIGREVQRRLRELPQPSPESLF